ncbi:MAG: CDP-glycerol glycerophosphotransferase family protein, partial [Marmoricola sp.]
MAPPHDTTSAPGGVRATARRLAARGARRLKHGPPALSVVVLAPGGDPARLRATIDSVRDQPSPRIEILVVHFDGGEAVARDAAGDDTRVRLVPADDLIDARKIGLLQSRAGHVLMASPGDAYPAGALAELVGELKVTDSVKLTIDARPRGRQTLETLPSVAGMPYLGTVVAVRVRLAGALLDASHEQDHDGLLIGLEILRRGFTTPGWTSYRSTRTESPGPFTAVVDPFPRLEAAIEVDTATLESLADLPRAQEERAQGALQGLKPFLLRSEVTDDSQWAALAAHARHLRDVGGAPYRTTRVFPRVLALLAADERRAEVAALAARGGDDFATQVREGRIIADLGVPGGLLPEDAFEVIPGEASLRVALRRLSVVDGVLRLELFVGVRHLDQAPTDIVRVELHDALGRTRPARTRLLSDAAVTRWMDEPFHDHDAGLVSAEVDVHDLAPGMYPVVVIWSDGDLERAVALADHLPSGSAGRRPVPLDEGRSVGLHLRNGRAAIGVLSEQPAWPELTGTLTRVEVDGDLLRLTTDREVDRVWFEGAGHRVHGTPGAAGFWTVPLSDDAWGLGTSPLPTGTYRIVLEKAGQAVPAIAAGAVMDVLPAEHRTALHRVQLQRGHEDRVVVRLDPLLADDELGRRAQRLLQLEHAADRPLDPRLVYFQSFTGQWANDNPLAIQAELHRRRPDLDVRWVVADASATAPPGTTPLLFRSREWYDVMTRASYLVTNIELEKWFRRRPGQQVLQTFHGYPSKAMGLGLWRPRGLMPSQIEAQLDHTSRVWNNLVTPAPEMDQYYRRDYAYDGTILSLGYPRNDSLVGPAAVELRTATRSRLGIGEDQHAVLYAPTWRDDLATDFRAARAVHHLDVTRAAAALGDDYVLLLRGHRFHAPSAGSAARVLDVTSYPEINQLIAAADAAVLDYSSLRFDFALTERPMVFLVPDLEEYTGRTRGFLWDYRETT